MTLELRNKIVQKIVKALQIGELDPYRIGEIEAKIGFSLNLNEADMAWAKHVWGIGSSIDRVHKRFQNEKESNI